jgi:hypothetical protein
MCALAGVVMPCDRGGACAYTDTGEWAGRVLFPASSVSSAVESYGPCAASEYGHEVLVIS